MSDTPAKPLKKYLITGGICLAVALALFFGRVSLGPETSAAAIAMAACDALFVPGMFCFLVGLLMWVANEGALDGVAWLGSYLGKTLVPGKRSSIERYSDFLEAHEHGKVLYLELGVGANTPVIIKYPFWRRTYANPEAVYACVNYGDAYAHPDIRDRSTPIDADIDRALEDLLEGRDG